jgi:hypothetical protein
LEKHFLKISDCAFRQALNRKNNFSRPIPADITPPACRFQLVWTVLHQIATLPTKLVPKRVLKTVMQWLRMFSIKMKKGNCLMEAPAPIPALFARAKAILEPAYGIELDKRPFFFFCMGINDEHLVSRTRKLNVAGTPCSKAFPRFFLKTP